MARNSLTTSTPQPVSQPLRNPPAKKHTQIRESLNSTLDETPDKQLVASYLRSMRNFRVKPGKPEWTEDQKNACQLFEQCRFTVNRMDVRKRVAEGGYVLTDAQCDRINDKIEAAVQVFKKAK